jgi:hypothetical protein
MVMRMDGNLVPGQYPVNPTIYADLAGKIANCLD